MYYTLTYDILTKDTTEQDTFKKYIKSCLGKSYWVKPLSSHYVVKCNDERIRRFVLQKLIEFSKANQGKFRFIISPLIDTGQVTGVASKELWPHLKNITKSNIDDFID
jgi:hypothetical protein